MSWREPDDEFGRQLVAAYQALLAEQADPWKAVDGFEPILEALVLNVEVRARQLPRVRLLGRELFESLGKSGNPVAMEVRHYCWHLQHLGDFETSSGLKDMLLVTLTRFVKYEGHPTDRCSLCAEFPNDLPFRLDQAGRAHFHDWLRKRGFDPRRPRKGP